MNWLAVYSLTTMSIVIILIIFSDIMWPWCWVGKRKLEAAMQQTAGLYDFKITWEPFLLRPGIPMEGVEKPPQYKTIRLVYAQLNFFSGC